MVEYGGFSFMFRIFPVLFMLGFLFIFGIIIYCIVISAKRNHKNNNSPVLSVEATVVSKRTDITHHHYHNSDQSMDHMDTSTWYYVTFQVESGDRMEFSVMGTDFGLIVEGDTGKLTFQGTRFLGFERKH